MQLLCICNRSAEEIIGFCAQKLYALELIYFFFFFSNYLHIYSVCQLKRLSLIALLMENI